MDLTKSPWTLPALLAVILAAMFGVLRNEIAAPATIAPADTSTRQFSAIRALERLRIVLADEAPHPVGSEANRAVADRIVSILRGQGYEPAVQEGTQCAQGVSACSVIRNIIAVQPGRQSGHAVLVTAHYDSVPAGTGAADDGAGVATLLEIAAVLRKREPLLHDTIFLFSDGEETGSLGARYFAENHPLMKTVGLVLNVEARGVTGPSLMFETSNGNARLIRLFAASAPHPTASSLFFEIYKRLPNTTDLSVYTAKGVAGLNFAFGRGTALYHSQRDDISHLSAASVQHHGDNVLGVLLAAGDMELAQLKSVGNATYFDVAGDWLVSWPSSINLIASVLLLGAILFLMFTARGAMSWRAAGWALVAVLGFLVLSAVLEWALSFPLGIWPDVNALEHPAPWWGRLALTAAALLTALLIARGPGIRAGAVAMLLAGWCVMAVLGVLVALVVPAATYMFLVPVALFVVGALICRVLGKTSSTALLAASVVAVAAGAYMALYHFLVFEMAISLRAAYLLALPLLLVGLPLIATLTAWVEPAPRRAWVGAATLGTVVIVCTVGHLGSHAYTADRPRSATFVYEQDGASGAARWRIDSRGAPAKSVMERAMVGFAKQEVLLYGFNSGTAYVRPAANLRLAGPQLRVTSDEVVGNERRISAELQAARENLFTGIGFAPNSPVLRVLVEGQPALVNSSVAPRRLLRVFGMGQRPIHVEIVARAGQKLPLTVLDVAQLGQNPEATQLEASREQTAVPTQLGDHSVVFSQVQL